MNKNNFIQTYKMLRTRLNKKMITDDYISNAADSMQVEYWRENIVQELFKELSLGNPTLIDISANAIKELYYKKLRIIKSDETQQEKQECIHKLCDGTGLVWAIIQYKNYPYPTECVFRCKCILGQNNPKGITQWSQEKYDKGYRINQDMVYKKEKEYQYDTTTYVNKIGEKYDF